MLIKHQANIIIPSKELGRLISKELPTVQAQILNGYAEEILKTLNHNRQSIISLTACLPVGTLVVIREIYDQAIHTGQLPKSIKIKAIKSNYETYADIEKAVIQETTQCS